MPVRLRTLLNCQAIVWLVLMMSAISQADDPARETRTAIEFRRDIFPILSSRCWECHLGADASSGIRLDVREEWLGETTGRPWVVVGKSNRSRVITVLEGRDAKVVMPAEGERLKPQEIATLRRWIDEGLVWDDQLLPTPPVKSDHWAFQPLRRAGVRGQGLGVSEDTAIGNSIDVFVAKKRETSLSMFDSRLAVPQKRTLIRRLSLDLLGLPPSRGEVEEFLADESPDFATRLVDRLLASPAYGERWARHWLDVARWAESEGYESNHPRPFAWRYRDYVIQAFNDDKPFDEFLRQQIAGDELQPYSDENLIATGFLAAARISSNEEDKWRQRNDVLVDIVNATGNAFLGLTIQCAQCHNHKTDPISARDYYRLQAFFVTGQPIDVALRGDELRREFESQRPAEYEPLLAVKQALLEDAKRRHREEIRKTLTVDELAVYDKPALERTADEEAAARQVDLKFQITNTGFEKSVAESDRKLFDEVKRKLAEIEKTAPRVPQTFAFHSPATSPHRLDVLPSLGFYPLPFDRATLPHERSYIKVRGDVHNIGPTVTAGFPAVFNSPRAGQSTRRDLANWLTDRRHPLTARVWVNRLWQWHFGIGLVATADDFGLRGAKPTHPELLDWLASELIDSGWSTKHIQRLIVTSQTYQTMSREGLFARRRVEAEVLRDMQLAVAGLLERRIGGPSVPMEARESSNRRNLYLFQRRGQPPTLQALFDGPNEASESCPQRHVSTTPLHSLFLLNNELPLRAAQALAARVESLAGSDREQQVDVLFHEVLNRPATNSERLAVHQFLDEQTAKRSGRDLPPKTPSPLLLLCHLVLSLNELSSLQ